MRLKAAQKIKQLKKIKICLVSSIPATLWSFYRKLPEKLIKEGFEIEICSSKGKELNYFRQQYGLTTHQVEIRRQISPLHDIVTIFQLIKIFKKQNFDIIHSHTPKAGLLCMIAAKITKTKSLIYTCHGLPLQTETGIKRLLLKYSEKLTCTLAHQVIVVGTSLKEKIIKYEICPAKKLYILCDGSACGVDLERFTTTEELRQKSKAIRAQNNIRSEDTIIGYIGRLVPDKGIEMLVESFTNLHAKNENIKLLIIGDLEPHRGKLSETTIKCLKEHPAIKHLNFITEIEPYYCAMDILVLPTKREGFPYTPLEAAAMGIPVIATKVTGCIDVIVDGQTGILVGPDDTIALSEAIEKLIASPQLRHQIGDAARLLVEEKFTSKRLLDAHVKLYRRMLR